MAEVDTFFDASLMIVLLISLFLIALAVMLPRLTAG